MPTSLRSSIRLAAPLVLCLAGLSQTATSQGLSREDLNFFETRIRPALVAHCYECHGPDVKEPGGKLRLDSREALRVGGESGAAVIEGRPDDSLLIQALQYDGLEMPPDQPLPQAVVNDFVEWVRRKAPDPRSTAGPAESSGSDPLGSQAERLWSLQPVGDPRPPEVQNRDWPRDPLDHFVLARLESAGLAPTMDAAPRTLVRRLYQDLIGLPPTKQRVDLFVAAYDRQGLGAIESLVDSLLAMPQFGERWGRHWLDVARYGESNGNDGLGRNPTFPHAWRYRDYVIASLNADVPYDRFLTEQLAGDLLPSQSPEQRDRQLVATGFLALGAKPAKAMNQDFEMDVVADQIDVVGRGILGLSVACARCHDHKFDPISTRDYYALAGIFTSTETLWGVAAHEGLTAPVTDLHVLQAAACVPPPEDFVETVLVLESNTGKPKPIPKSKWPAGTPLAMGVRDRAQPADCKINIKGESRKLGESVPRGYLSACAPESLGLPPVPTDQSGRRELARWLTHPQHPLTARVLVNRIWLHLFGEGLVRTPDDFGVYGERPTHPDLLDHLAARFVRDGWSLKRLIRSVVLSRTYQLSSTASAELLQADGANRLLGRHDRRRLDAESLRDAVLAASGQLDLSPGQGSIIRHRDILVNLAGNLHQPSVRRSVYLCYLRSSPPPSLAAFDLPEFTQPTGRREASTIPGQALHLYNSPFMVEQSERFARLLIRQAPTEEGRVHLAFQRALGREPRGEEVRQSLDLVQAIREELAAREPMPEPISESENGEIRAWAGFCQALLATNEFRYVD